MEWQALISLLVFLFLSFILPFILAVLIVMHDARDDGHAERDVLFRQVILRQHIPFMTETMSMPTDAPGTPGYRERHPSGS